MYLENNIFHKIIKGEVKVDFLRETEHCLIFKDVNPRASIHRLLIPKGNYTDYTDFLLKASPQEKKDLYDLLGTVLQELGNYRVIINTGRGGSQEIPHLHLHIMQFQGTPPKNDSLLDPDLREESDHAALYDVTNRRLFRSINPVPKGLKEGEEVELHFSLHLILTPKKSYRDYLDFSANASPEEQKNLEDLLQKTLVNLKDGYRIIINREDGFYQYYIHIFQFGLRQHAAQD